MGNYGIKVSAKGFDAKTAADKNLSLSSKFGTLKIAKEGTTSVTTNGSGNGTTEIRHNLGYAPSYMVFRQGTADWSLLDGTTYANSWIPDPGIANYWADDDLHHALHAYTSSTSLFLKASGATASKKYGFKYYIFADAASSPPDNKLITDKDAGIKIAKSSYDVLTAGEAQLDYTTKYKTIQYYPGQATSFDLTLPGIWASPVDTSVEEGTYMDIFHNKNKIPLYFAFFSSESYTDGILTQVPYAAFNGIDVFAYMVSSFADNARIRISFYRLAQWFAGSNQQDFADDETIDVRVFVFD